MLIGDDYIVKYLLENGADVDQQNNYGDTAMHFAAQAGNEKIITILLEFNAKNLKNMQCTLNFCLLLSFNFFNYTSSITFCFFELQLFLLFWSQLKEHIICLYMIFSRPLI